MASVLKWDVITHTSGQRKGTVRLNEGGVRRLFEMVSEYIRKRRAEGVEYDVLAIWISAHGSADGFHGTDHELVYILGLLRLIQWEINKLSKLSVWIVNDSCNGGLDGHNKLNFAPMPPYFAGLLKNKTKRHKMRKYKDMVIEYVEDGHDIELAYDREACMVALLNAYTERTGFKQLSSDLLVHQCSGTTIGQAIEERGFIYCIAKVLTDVIDKGG
eukprot:799050_1